MRSTSYDILPYDLLRYDLLFGTRQSRRLNSWSRFVVSSHRSNLPSAPEGRSCQAGGDIYFGLEGVRAASATTSLMFFSRQESANACGCDFLNQMILLFWKSLQMKYYFQNKPCGDLALTAFSTLQLGAPLHSSLEGKYGSDMAVLVVLRLLRACYLLRQLFSKNGIQNNGIIAHVHNADLMRLLSGF